MLNGKTMKAASKWRMYIFNTVQISTKSKF